MHVKYFILLLSILSFSSFANDISEFWAAEPEYLKTVKINVSQLYNENPDLHVIEFSIKRDPTKTESESEYFIYLKALDKADITPDPDPAVQAWAKSEGIEANEIANVLHNKWAELVKP